MQENEFEGRIRKEMETLQLVPAEAVWKNVAAGIQKEKRRRRFLVILFFFTLLAGLGGWYFYNNSNHTLPALAIGNRDTSVGISSNKKDVHSLNKYNKGDSGVLGVAYQAKNNKNRQVAKLIKKAEVKNDNNQLSSNKLTVTKGMWKPADKKGGINREQPGVKQTIATANTEIAGNREKQIEPLNSAEQSLINPYRSSQFSADKADSFKQNPAAAVIAQPEKDTVNTFASAAKPVEKIKTASNNKWNLSFSVFTGVSNNLSRLALFSGTTADYASASPVSLSTGTTTVNSSLPKLAYKSNFSYGLGIYLQKQVSKTIGFSAGINYHFASASSLVGSTNSTARTIYDTTLGNRITINQSYNNGQSVSYRNKYYLLELPLSILIRLNKNKSKPVLFTAGLAPSYLMTSNALYADTYQNVYYTNNSQFKKWALTAQAGFRFTITNANHFNVSIGPEIQYGFNNMAKSVTQTNQHLFSAGLQASINLK